MQTETARARLLAMSFATESFPFGPDVALFKVAGKMFATLGQEQGQGRLNLKCEPQEALFLRDHFPAVMPGYHMNKKHWNTIYLDGSIPQGEIERMMENSYALVYQKLTIKQRDELK